MACHHGSPSARTRSSTGWIAAGPGHRGTRPSAANRTAGLDLRFRYDNNRSNLLRRSDHWPFLFNEVPAIFVHTGLHPDYHTERDHPDTLEYEKMARVVQLVYELSWDLAAGGPRPVFNPPAP